MDSTEKRQRNQHTLFDYLTETFGIKNDVQLALEVGITPSALSKFRSKKRRVTPTLIIAIHKRYGVPIAEIESKI